MTGDSNKILGKPLNELNLRAKYGINILSIKRKNEMLESINPEENLHQEPKLRYYRAGIEGSVRSVRYSYRY
jgi:CPA2 family monovalent cation:H+ antiporter-2